MREDLRVYVFTSRTAPNRQIIVKAEGVIHAFAKLYDVYPHKPHGFYLNDKNFVSIEEAIRGGAVCGVTLI